MCLLETFKLFYANTTEYTTTKYYYRIIIIGNNTVALKQNILDWQTISTQNRFLLIISLTITLTHLSPTVQQSFTLNFCSIK